MSPVLFQKKKKRNRVNTVFITKKEGKREDVALISGFQLIAECHFNSSLDSPTSYFYLLICKYQV